MGRRWPGTPPSAPLAPAWAAGSHTVCRAFSRSSRCWCRSVVPLAASFRPLERDRPRLAARSVHAEGIRDTRCDGLNDARGVEDHGDGDCQHDELYEPDDLASEQQENGDVADDAQE